MCHAKRLLELPNLNLIEAVCWIINLFPREHRTSQCWERGETQGEKERERSRGKDGGNRAVPAQATIQWTLPERGPLYNTVRAWCHLPHHHPGNQPTCACLCAEGNKEINLSTTEHKQDSVKKGKAKKKKKEKGIKALAGKKKKKASWDDGWDFCCYWGTKPM